MDFIAEIILGYVDSLLSIRLRQEKVDNYRILRYRDDYRIFTNEKEMAIKIAKLLTEVLAEVNLTINASKTSISDNIIHDSVKHDKMSFLEKNEPDTVQKRLLILHKMSLDFPNSGSVEKGLAKVADSLSLVQLAKENLESILAILVDISFRNPRTYPIVVVLIGKILPILKAEQVKEVFRQIDKKFSRLPNTEFLLVWLQRLIIKERGGKTSKNKLCQYTMQLKRWGKSSVKIWKIKDNFKRIFNDNPIVSVDEINRMPQIPKSEEVKLFWHY